MEIVQVAAFEAEDNYFYLLLGDAGETALVDSPFAAPVIEELEKRGRKLDFIFNTHHHWDHTDSNLELKERYGCRIFGSASDSARVPGIDRRLTPGEEFTFDGEPVRVLGADGHTIGHILYHFPRSGRLFCGDTLFSLGCGRLFEGSARQMWESLDRIRALPPETMLYCAHEYTLDNSAFALRADPANQDLQARVREAETLRRGGLPTVPVSLASELLTNPFLRPESRDLQKFARKEGAALWEVFGALREAKDRFDRGEEL